MIAMAKEFTNQYKLKKIRYWEIQREGRGRQMIYGNEEVIMSMGGEDTVFGHPVE